MEHWLRQGQSEAVETPPPTLNTRRVASEVEPLSFAQQRLWFLNQLQPDSSAHNLRAPIQLIGRLDVAALDRSLNEIVRRHEALRTTFVDLEGQPRQRIAPELRDRKSVV